MDQVFGHMFVALSGSLYAHYFALVSIFPDVIIKVVILAGASERLAICRLFLGPSAPKYRMADGATVDTWAFGHSFTSSQYPSSGAMFPAPLKQARPPGFLCVSVTPSKDAQQRYHIRVAAGVARPQPTITRRPKLQTLERHTTSFPLKKPSAQHNRKCSGKKSDRHLEKPSCCELQLDVAQH